MNYTLSQLTVFNKVVESKSITIAAHDLFMTQPAVSSQLKNFQNNFNTQLYERKGRGIIITEFGHEIASACRKILNETNDLQRLTYAYDNVLQGKLKIASASTGKYVIPYFLTDFLSTHGNINLELNVSNKTDVLESLKNNDVDFAVISVVPDDLKLNEELLIDNILFLTGKTKRNYKDKPLIFRENGSATRSTMEHYYLESKKTQKKIILQSNEAVKQAVMSDLGISILPLIGIKNELLNGQIEIIEYANLPFITKWRLVWLKDKVLSPVALEYLKYVRSHKQKIIERNFKWYLEFLKIN